MKKSLSLFLCFALLLSALSACSAGGETASPASASPAASGQPEAATLRSFTDSTGRTVEVPAEITKVAITGPLAQIVVFALAPDRLVGVSNAWEPSAQQYLDSKYYSLPLLGQLYGGKGEMNLEELLASGAQVVIDVGEPKGTIAEDMDQLTEQTQIPFVHITATLKTMDDAYRALGELLNMPEEAAALADYCQRTYSRISAVSENVDKVNLLYITGTEGLNVIAKDSYHSEVIDMLSNNLAVVDAPSSKGTGNEVDMEQILNWNPDYIIFSPDSIYASTGEDPTWQKLPAVQAGRYCEVPNGPYNWMGFPPSAQRLLGMMWMAKVLYPEQTDYDLYQEAKEYFALFYHSELSREQYDSLVANSLGNA